MYILCTYTLYTEVATGRSEIPYDNLQSLGVQVYGMPPDIPFHSPLLYNQQQLQQLLANLEKIVFLKVRAIHVCNVNVTGLVITIEKCLDISKVVVLVGFLTGFVFCSAVVISPAVITT